MTEALTTIIGRFGVDETVGRLEAALAARGVTVFARIDHAAGAAAVGLDLRPTTLLIFGNARAGTKLMRQDQRIGIDLPLKALVWTAADGGTRISWNPPAAIAERHGLTDPVVAVMAGMLEAVVKEAAGSPA